MAEAFISGRSRATAAALIDAAKTLGVDAQRIRTSSQPAGYFVPNKVAKAYQEAIGAPETDTEEVESDTEGAETDTSGDGTEESEGQEAPAQEEPAPADEDGVDPQPPGNASQAVWADWAKRNKGYDESEGLTRDQLKQRFGA